MKITAIAAALLGVLFLAGLAIPTWGFFLMLGALVLVGVWLIWALVLDGLWR